jgi:hypothetical protein
MIDLPGIGEIGGREAIKTELSLDSRTGERM